GPSQATLKNVPYVFLWRAIPGRHPYGPSQATLKNVPYVFLWRTIPGRHPYGPRSPFTFNDE
ncbi:hypothetical protein, partial [Pectobacterium odoriferum]